MPDAEEIEEEEAAGQKPTPEDLAAAEAYELYPLTRLQDDEVMAEALGHCPSSDNLGQFRWFSKGGSGSSGLGFKRLAGDAASVCV